MSQDVSEQSQRLRNIEKVRFETQQRKVTIGFYFFLVTIAVFCFFNIWFGFYLVGGVEAFLLIVSFITLALKNHMSVRLFSQLGILYTTVLMYAFLFFPTVSNSAYLWVMGLPVFTSYLLGSKGVIRWSLGFGLACTATGLVLWLEGVSLSWPWYMAPNILAAYIVIAAFSVFFTRDVESYVSQLKEAKNKAREDANALVESETRYKTLLQSSLNAVGVHRGGKWVYANPACLKVLGAKKFGDIANMPILKFVHPDNQAEVAQRIEKMAETKKPSPVLEEKLVRLNGEEFTAEVTAAPIMFDGTESFMVMIKDISESKRHKQEQQKLQQQLEHAQRLESLGVLAGGIAHDFNNLLAAIIGNAELARLEIRGMPKAEKFMDNIDESCDHAADLCRQMLAYAGKGKYVAEAIDINSLIKSMSRLIRVSVDSNVSFKVNLDAALPLIEGDISQIKQIILNFIVNSADAIGDKTGVIKISTGSVYLDQKALGSIYNGSNLSEGKYVMFEVKDSGCGIDKESLKKVFDPFFTTKNKGSGLGLSAVLGIIKSHHGGVKVLSELGKGTSFQVFLPLSNQLEVDSLIETGEVNLWTGEGYVLIVDDDENVRNVTSLFAKKLQFDVITASDGREGVEAFRQNHQKIRVVLLDMTMPNLSGIDAMVEMRKINAEVPILIVSGYSEVETANLEGKAKPDAFISKPFKFTDMKKALYKYTRV